MSTALILQSLTTEIMSRVQGAVGDSLEATNIEVKSPEHLAQDKIGIYIYHFNRNPEYVNDPPVRESAGKYKKPLLVVDAHLLIYSTFKDSVTEMNHLENIADDFFMSPSIKQTHGTEENIVKVMPKAMGLEELNKFWSMFSNKSQAMANFYHLSPIYIYPKIDIIEDKPEVQPINESNLPNLNISTNILKLEEL